MEPGKRVLPGKLTYEIMPEEEAEKVKKVFRAFDADKYFVRMTPSKFMIPDTLFEAVDRLYNFKFQPTDVVIMAFPKTGTNWMEEIVWTMRHNPNLDNPKAQETIFQRRISLAYILGTSDVKTDQANRSYQLDQEFLKTNVTGGSYQRNVENVEREKRQIKTHLTFDFYSPDLLDTCKVVSILRNPKDVMQSLFNFNRVFERRDFCGDFECMVDMFINSRVVFSPYWEHVRLIWEKRHHPNVHVLFYEELLKNPEDEIRKLDIFLGTNLSEMQLKNVIEHTSFQKMKKRDEESGFRLACPYLKDDVIKKEGGFFRKGKVGSWKMLPLSDEMEQKLNKWIEQNEDRIGISFKYE